MNLILHLHHEFIQEISDLLIINSKYNKFNKQTYENNY